MQVKLAKLQTYPALCLGITGKKLPNHIWAYNLQEVRLAIITTLYK